VRKVPYTNTTGRIRTVARQMVTPGETVYIDERDHPNYKPAKKSTQREPKQHSDPVLALLDNAVRDIVPQLPTLTTEQFDKIQQAERDGNKTRKSLKEAFDLEHLRRAELVETLGGDYDTILADLLSGTDAELAEGLDTERKGDARQPVIDALQDEIDRRKAAGEAGEGE
jgi:hypothetical protein